MATSKRNVTGRNALVLACERLSRIVHQECRVTPSRPPGITVSHEGKCRGAEWPPSRCCCIAENKLPNARNGQRPRNVGHPPRRNNPHARRRQALIGETRRRIRPQRSPETRFQGLRRIRHNVHVATAQITTTRHNVQPAVSRRYAGCPLCYQLSARRYTVICRPTDLASLN